MADKDPKWVPPYVAFPTVTTLIERMAAEGGAPPRIDRSYLRSFSGGYQSQVIAALKSLGLIDDATNVGEQLTSLVEAPDRDARGRIFADILRKYYPEPVRLGTIKATQGQLEDAFREYGLSGDTLRKAIAFYLGAAKYANMPVSVNFRVPSVTAADGRKGTRTSKKGTGTSDPAALDAPPEDQPAELGPKGVDPTIAAWLKRIPPSGKPWAAWERERWIDVLTTILNAIYAEDEIPDDDAEAG
jgi:hypothetical protein